jgi:hypothetical protein
MVGGSVPIDRYAAIVEDTVISGMASTAWAMADPASSRAAGDRTRRAARRRTRRSALAVPTSAASQQVDVTREGR